MTNTIKNLFEAVRKLCVGRTSLPVGAVAMVTLIGKGCHGDVHAVHVMDG